MIPYPSRSRAERATRRRRAQYERTVTAKYANCLQRYVLGPLQGELGFDLSQIPTSAEVLRPHREREAQLADLARARMRQMEPVFRTLQFDTDTKTLDTLTITSA